MSEDDLVYVRPCTGRDITTIARIDEEIFGTDAMGTMRLSKLLLGPSSEEYVCYVATVEATEKMVGFVLAKSKETSVEILRIAVMPMYRGSSTGRRLLAQLLGERPEDIIRCVALVPETNLPAQLFFRAVGFPTTKVKRDAFGAGVDGYRFIKELDPPC